MNTLLGRMAFRVYIFCVAIIITHCYSLSNFKTAKVLGKTDDGKPKISTVTGISTGIHFPYLIQPEFNLRYTLEPDFLEMGNRIWLMAGPGFEGYGLITIGAGLSIDGKLKLFSKNRFSMAADFEPEFLIYSTGVWHISISPTLLLTYEFMDWLSITIAPKVKYDISFRYLFFGGIVTFDLGKKIGFLPELGYFDYYDIDAGYHSDFFYLGLAMRFNNAPVKKNDK